METPPDNIWLYLLGLSTMVNTFYMRRQSNEQDSLRKEFNESKIDLANFKTEVAKTYARDETIQNSLARIHERMDEGFSEIRDDIKHLLRGGKG